MNKIAFEWKHKVKDQNIIRIGKIFDKRHLVNTCMPNTFDDSKHCVFSITYNYGEYKLEKENKIKHRMKGYFCSIFTFW